MITKILDRYYTNKLKKYLLDETFWYSDDYDFITRESKEKVELLVKKKEFNDNEYQILVSASTSYCLKAIAQFDKVEKQIKENMKKYKKWLEEKHL